ncbi:DegV family protein [Streptococcus sp. zg-JUN1979]|uniref:DegV family protein n=1 Tax=Streptococcus sp. zg-JUN1979 TaxID=3391450 RepID=UPI0039A45BEE
MTWKIVVDSGCDIKQLNDGAIPIAYERVPFTLQVGTEVFMDDEGLVVDELMGALSHSDKAASSACPSPDAFLRAYRGYDKVIAITITSQLSGSHNSAQIAKQMLLEEHPDTQIHLIDSLSAGGEVDLLVMTLQALINQGLSFEEVVEAITRYQERTKLLFVLSSVDNLVKNGRLPKLVGKAIGLLNIRLVGEASDKGTLEVLDKPRGAKKALRVAYERLKSSGYKGHSMVIAHQDNQVFCQQLSDMIKGDFPSAEITCLETSGLCSFYAEKSGVLIGYETI